MATALFTPKFRSKEFRDLKAGLGEFIGESGLREVFQHALERRSAEQALAKVKHPKPGQGLKKRDLGREVLAQRLSEVFLTEDEAAFACVRDLDKVCSKERHIVTETKDGEIAERMKSYPALALPRERARMVWALARDPRDEAHQVAISILERVHTTEGVTQADPVLARQYKEQASQLTEAAAQLTSLEAKVQKAEEERARLLAQLGAKERALREEREQRASDRGIVQGLRAELSALQGERERAERTVAQQAALRTEVEELQAKLRRTTKLADASKSLSDTQDELERSKRQTEEAHRASEKLRVEVQNLQATLQAEQERFKGEQENLREELRQARRRLTDLERLVPEDKGEPVQADTVAILLDQANLAATAFMSERRKVNFSALLHHLTAGRHCKKAVAFVVDNGGTHFDAFCNTLRQTGWDLRLKKPKFFTDGTSKADWDMGIAVEAVLLKGQVETVILGSGDGDFAPLIKLLKRWGLRVEVASFADGLAIDLQNAADGVTVLGPESLE